MQGIMCLSLFSRLGLTTETPAGEAYETMDAITILHGATCLYEIAIATLERKGFPRRDGS